MRLGATNEAGSAETWLRVLNLMLESLRLHVPAIDSSAAEEHRTRIFRLQTQLEATPTSERALLTAGALSEALEDYSRTIERIHLGQARELQAVAGMLARALIQANEGARVGLDSLRSVQTQLEKANSLDDIREIKARLAESLKLIERETARQREGTFAFQQSVKDTIQQINQMPAVRDNPPDEDPVTGLDGPARAEAAVGAAHADPLNRFIVLFRIDRVERINARFGYAVGDQVMNLATQHIAQRLGAGDQLFRWRGPNLMALLERDLHPAQVRTEMARLSPNRVEHTVKVQNRSVLLPVHATWIVVPLAEMPTPAAAIQMAENFRNNTPGHGGSE